MNQSETKICQNCKTSFIIDASDFDFYKKISVSPPTFCPECRLQRRYAWRNERSLFKQQCDYCKKSILSAYPQPRSFPVFCHECWISDAWDPMSYGRDYDFSRPFFAQWEDLMQSVPRLNIFQMNSLNSPYANIIRDSKNCYLSYSLVGCEEVFYSKNIDRSRHIFDCVNVTDSERCSWDVQVDKSYNVHYSFMARACLDSLFLYDCHNARNCFMSVNLRNGEYVFRGKQLTREAYDVELKKIDMRSERTLSALRKEFDAMRVSALHKYADIVKSSNVTGNALANSKNAHACFEAYDLEDTRYLSRCFAVKDSMDVNNTGLGSELIYEYVSGGKAMKNVKCTVASFGPQTDCIYTGWCNSSSDLFGCFGLKNKHYCVLNKQYTESEYRALVPKIIEHMNSMPYEGKNGRVYRYGEFFPIEVSPFAYNESLAYEHFPFSKEEAEARGYRWRDPEVKHPHVDVKPEDLLEISSDIKDDIVQKTIGCAHKGECLHQCTKAFRIIPDELAWYRSIQFSLPRLCPNCRHYERLALKNPWKLWHRKCHCNGTQSARPNDWSHSARPDKPVGRVGQANREAQSIYKNTATHFHGDTHCPNEFETTYSPERPEVVYCESCYQQEIA